MVGLVRFGFKPFVFGYRYSRILAIIVCNQLCILFYLGPSSPFFVIIQLRLLPPMAPRVLWIKLKLFITLKRGRKV
ncbi:hypothetical protein Hdeb2414_s0003g00083251 [Helianthus debilis subsp. tardiflorus]